jgi:hypothetical protein
MIVEMEMLLVAGYQLDYYHMDSGESLILLVV